MSIETIEIPYQRKLFNKLSNSYERCEYLKVLIAKHDEKLHPVIEWHLNDIEDTVDYRGSPKITAKLRSQEVGTIRFQFLLSYYSGCSDISHSYYREETLNFIINNEFLILIFEHPKEFRILD